VVKLKHGHPVSVEQLSDFGSGGLKDRFEIQRLADFLNDLANRPLPLRFLS
jgi:hypothetical protein